MRQTPFWTNFSPAVGQRYTRENVVRGPSFLGGISEALGDVRLQQAESGPIKEVKERHLGDAVARLLQGTAPLMRLKGLGRADTKNIPQHK